MDKPEQSGGLQGQGPGAGPFMDFISQEGARRMVFCVPGSFLRRGCGTAGLDGWLG